MQPLKAFLRLTAALTLLATTATAAPPDTAAPLVSRAATPYPPGYSRSHPDDLIRPGDPTPTPDPASIPVSGWKYNFPPHAGTRLGIHFLRGSQIAFEYLRRARPPVVKAVDDVGLSDAIEEQFPEMLTIGRFNGQDENMRSMDPTLAADLYINQWLEKYRLNPNVDYWEGWNEYVAVTAADWNWYAAFEARRACRMKALGLRAAIGGFSTGKPEYNEMLLFLPAIRSAALCQAIFTLHEYSAPTLQYGFGLGIPNRPAYPDRGILLFRYRYWYEDIFKPLNLAVPLVITEAGIDGLVGAGRPGPHGSGWLDFTEWWERSGLTTDSRAFYVSQLLWYDRELRKDDYLIGVTLFTAGGYGLWETFSVEPILPALGEALAANP